MRNKNPRRSPRDPDNPGGEAPEVGGTPKEPSYKDQPPNNVAFRWLWKYSEMILGALTFAVLVIYGAQWWQAKETRELENRAYVIVKGVGFRQTPGDPGLSDVVVTITNTGKTPGLNGTTVARMEGRETPIPEEAGFPPLDTTPSKTVMAPQVDGEIKLGPIPNLAGEQMAAQAREQAAQAEGEMTQKRTVRSTPFATPQPTPIPETKGGKFIYVYGVITYDDVFGKPHQTRFCYFNAPRTIDWHACAAFNSFN